MPRTVLAGLLHETLALIQQKNADGSLSSTILLAGGLKQVEEIRLEILLRRLCRDLSLGLDALRQFAAEQLGRGRDLPIPLAPGIALACVPLSSYSRHVKGYVMAHRVKRCDKLEGGPFRTVILFDEGTSVNSLAERRTVDARLEQANRLARMQLKEWQQMWQNPNLPGTGYNHYVLPNRWPFF